jgi:small-conductance mechanosensitive channel
MFQSGRTVAIAILGAGLFAWLIMLAGVASSHAYAKTHSGGLSEDDRASNFGATWFLLWAHMLVLLVFAAPHVLGIGRVVARRLLMPMLIIVIGLLGPHTNTILAAMRVSPVRPCK